ncbi:unnamed protein product, partial [Heterosigma akashiwo]
LSEAFSEPLESLYLNPADKREVLCHSGRASEASGAPHLEGSGHGWE